MCLEIIYFIFMYKNDLALNDLQSSICHKTKQDKTRNVELIKKNYDWTEDYIAIPWESRLEKVKSSIEKVNKFLKYIPTYITQMNELIHAGTKLVGDKDR